MKGLIALTLTLAVLLASPVLSVSPVQAQDSSTSSGTYVLELDDNLIYELSRRQGLKSFLPTNKTFDRVLLKYVQTNARTTRSPSIFDPSKEGNVDASGLNSLLLSLTPQLVENLKKGKMLESPIDPKKDIGLIKVIYEPPTNGDANGGIPAVNASNSNANNANANSGNGGINNGNALPNANWNTQFGGSNSSALPNNNLPNNNLPNNNLPSTPPPAINSADNVFGGNNSTPLTGNQNQANSSSVLQKSNNSVGNSAFPNAGNNNPLVPNNNPQTNSNLLPNNNVPQINSGQAQPNNAFNNQGTGSQFGGGSFNGTPPVNNQPRNNGNLVNSQNGLLNTNFPPLNHGNTNLPNVQSGNPMGMQTVPPRNNGMGLANNNSNLVNPNSNFNSQPPIQNPMANNPAWGNQPNWSGTQNQALQNNSPRMANNFPMGSGNFMATSAPMTNGPLPQRQPIANQNYPNPNQHTNVSNTGSTPVNNTNANSENEKVDADNTSSQPVANGSTTLFSVVWFMFFCSVGLNIYLLINWRTSYMRYQDLADDLRHTFSQNNN